MGENKKIGLTHTYVYPIIHLIDVVYSLKGVLRDDMCRVELLIHNIEVHRKGIVW